MLRWAISWIIALLSARIFTVSYDLNDCTSHLPAVCNFSVTEWVLIWVNVKVKFIVSLTSHEGSLRGRNVSHPPSHLHSAQL
jgi:hypothetical protein